MASLGAVRVLDDGDVLADGPVPQRAGPHHSAVARGPVPRSQPLERQNRERERERREATYLAG
jgi:hypothetical protein